MTTKFQIYTVPGQVYYNSTRKLVLQGADGIVFVADSRKGKMDENLESFQNLEENLKEYGMDIKSIPFVVQYNKRDLPDIYSVEEMSEKLNKYNAPYFEAVAVTGEGVFPTLKKLSQMVLESLNRQQGSMAVRSPRKVGEAKEAAPAKAKAAAPVPVAAAAAATAHGGGGARSAPAATLPAPAASAPAARAGAPEKAPLKVVREQVTESPGVKPIERRSPSPEPVVRKRHAAAAPAPAASEAKGGSKAGLWVAVAVVVLGVVGAGLYFSGALNALLGK